MSLFKNNKSGNKVENPYCSLGLQKTMVISKATGQSMKLNVICAIQIISVTHAATSVSVLRDINIP